MPTIIRVKQRKEPYVIISRKAVEDTRLSWAARGVLGFLLAKPNDWEVRVDNLQRCGDLKRDAIYKLLKELQKYGYMYREQSRDARGCLSRAIYTVFEEPQTPCTENPYTVLPDTDEPYPVKTTQQSKQITNKLKNKIITTTSHPGPGQEINPGGGECNLIFPSGLSDAKIAEAEKRLSGLPLELTQQLLDELAGRMAANTIRGSPLAYLRGLAKRAAKGEFTPELALEVAAKRNRQRQIATAKKRALKSVPPLPPPSEESELTRQIAKIGSHAKQRQ